MTHHATEYFLELYLDGEAPGPESAQLQQHLGTCSHCALALAELARLKRSVRLSGDRYQPSAEFRQRITETITTAPIPTPLFNRWKLLLVGGLAVVLALLTIPLTLRLSRTGAEEAELREAIDLHVTALASQSPVEVVSSDRHTVKPWFQGKLPFAFNLPEVAGTPYSLDGGRLAYVHGHACAQLIYSLRQHHLSVFVCPGASEQNASSSSPFPSISWSGQDLHYVAVGDTAVTDLRELERLWQASNGAENR